MSKPKVKATIGKVVRKIEEKDGIQKISGYVEITVKVGKNWKRVYLKLEEEA